MTERPEITTLEDLMPLLAEVTTCKELGAVVIANVPLKLKRKLAFEARGALGFEWTDNTVKHWLTPSYHTDARTEAHRKASRHWNSENPEARRKHVLRWKAANREADRNATRQWREENSEAVREAGKRRRKENPDYWNEYVRQRKALDPAFALACAARSRIYCALQAAIGNPSKSRPSIDLLGCSADEYRAYLEALFEPGMTWENWGEWHIDHVRPLASFDLSDPDQQALAFHFSNTRPMWADQNLSKGSLWRGERHRHR